MVLILLSVLIVLAGIAIYAVGKFKASERALAGYCREARVGESMKDARNAAEKLGMVATRDKVSAGRKPSMSIESDGSWWSAMSFCSLTHDGDRITGISYNPWYH